MRLGEVKKAPIEKTKKPWEGPIKSLFKNIAFETRQEKTLRVWVSHVP
jgi:hypothetical protein